MLSECDYTYQGKKYEVEKEEKLDVEEEILEGSR